MPPPIPPAPVGTLMLNTPGPSLVIEAFVDFCCPFSKKLFTTVYALMPSLAGGGKVDLLLQCVPQPWHAQSAYMHEAALAVKSIDESKFFVACEALFAAQEAFFDAPTADKSANQIKAELAEVVSKATDLDTAAVIEQLAIKGEGNCGNSTTPNMKWAIKYHRVRSSESLIIANHFQVHR